MKMQRAWCMPNANTFSIKPIKELLEQEVTPVKQMGGIVIDPFARNSRVFSTVTNDLNPVFDTDYHEDAYDFLKRFGDNSVDVVLYDPPYSLRQVSESYQNVGINVTAKMTSSNWRRKHLDEIQRVLKPHGKAICFGWNSNGVGKKRGFTLDEVLLVAHGGSHNDTIVTVETKKL